MKLSQVVREETDGWHWRLLLARLILAPLPPHVGNRVRAYVLRFAGFRIGHGTVIWGTPTITGSGDLYARLSMGEQCWLNVGVFFNLGARITVGNRVGLGHQVMLLTESHEIGDATRRTGPLTAAPITINDGVWVGARALILTGVTIGAGAIVAAGAVVAKNVPPNVLVAGVPARIIKELQ